MQDINSDERYTQFTQAIIDAAERRAEALITGAEREKAEMLRAAVNNGTQVEYNRLTGVAERTRSQLKANAAQDMRRELLQYRESLVQRLYEQVRTQCDAFVSSDKYSAFLQGKINNYSQHLQDGNVVVNVRDKDKDSVAQMCKQYKNVSVIACDEIKIGGIRFSIRNKIFDETIDAGLEKEQEKFLSYCGLKVV